MSSPWHRIEDLFHQAAALAPPERDRFLAQACGSDTALRHEIESLLENDPSKSDLIEATIEKTLNQILAAAGEPRDDLIGTKVGPYSITELIGAGGMGRVYAADDSRLGRRVALKVLPGGLGGDPVALERFRREARILSALNHPNICIIFDVLDSDDHTFIVMEYIDGAPLRGPVSFDMAAKYAMQICDALDAAHRKGFVHHDLKPANIQVTESGIKLLDFGLARIARAQDEATRTMGLPAGVSPVLSRASVIMGTPAYMSPEQAEGKAVDQRSDIFSLGAVVYELVTGRRAFHGESTAAVIRAVLRDEPAPFDAPPALARVVMRCLEKQPEERFQTTAQVKEALAQIGTVPLDPQPSVAVLPFANLSADKEDEYFSDGLTEEIINALAHVPGLKVIARTSAFAFRGKEQDVRQIAEALGVRTVLEGRVRRSANRIRITAQLIEAGEGSHLWSDRFDRELTDVFAIQDEIAVAIAAALKVTLATDRRRPSHETEDKEAHQLYLRGRYLQNQRRPELLHKGIECFERAAERDPNYARPYAGLSDLLCITGFWGREAPAKILPRAIAAATKAIAIDESLGEAHAALAFARDVHYWDWAGGDSEFKRAIQLNPNSPLGHTWYSYHLSILGHHDEAIEHARMGVDLDPLSTSVNFGAVRAYFFGRRYEEAIAQSRRGLELGSDDFPTLFVLGESYLQKGVIDEALGACKESVAASDRHPVALGSLAHVYGSCGMHDEALRIIEELKKASQESYVPPAAIAHAYLGLGLIDESLSWLERAWEDRSTTLPYLVCHPSADRFRSNPGFQDLRRRMNLGH